MPRRLQRRGRPPPPPRARGWSPALPCDAIQLDDLRRRRHDRIVLRAARGERVTRHLLEQTEKLILVHPRVVTQSRDFQPAVERRESLDEGVRGGFIRIPR